MMYLDTVDLLAVRLLVKVDRAIMAVSLEARRPLLDHRSLEFRMDACRSPWKMRDGEGKWALKQVTFTA